MPPKQRAPITRATTLRGIPNAFRAEPLSANEMQFYSGALDKHRNNFLQRAVKDDLLESAEQGFFFKGVLYGNRGNGKSTEINRLLTDPAIKEKFLVVRLDGLNQLNPQTFGVADVIILLGINLIVEAQRKCQELGKAFHEAPIMENDLQKELAPFFPHLQNKIQKGETIQAEVQVNVLSLLKLGLRRDSTEKADLASESETLENLIAFLARKVKIVSSHLPGYEMLVIGENFDKDQIPKALLEQTFVQYAPLFKTLPLHLFFTLPIPFVNSNDTKLPFDRDRQYAIYDIPVCLENHKPNPEGIAVLNELLEKRADTDLLFAEDALGLLLQAASGDLHLLFTMIVTAGKHARYRKEDHPETEEKILLADVKVAVSRELSVFRNRMGTVPGDSDPTTWESKKQKLRAIYENSPDAKIPDDALYQLLSRRAVLYFNGKGRYGVHPLAVEMLREQFSADATFTYKGGGVDL